MDAYTIESMLLALGADRVSIAGGGSKVQSTCLLAPWTHSSGKDTHPSMVVFVEGRHGHSTYACLGCHHSGSFKDLVLWLWVLTGQSTWDLVAQLDEGAPDPSKIEFHGLRNRLKDLDDAKVKRRNLAKRIRETQESNHEKWFDFEAIALADAVEVIPEDVYAPYRGSVPKYAMERGLTTETCKHWELGHDFRRKRLLFPMRNHHGHLVAISGRLYACPRCGGTEIRKVKGERDRCDACDGALPPKYLHSKGFDRNLFLYGENQRSEGQSRVFVVEGNLDAPLMWQAGYRPTVATLGSYPVGPQIEKLVAWWDHIVVVGDGDKAGREMAHHIKDGVADRVKVSVCDLPDGTDPGSLLCDDRATMDQIMAPFLSK